MPTVKEHIKACLINARSLRNKFTDLETLAAMDEYHIIGVAETWINTENRDYLAEYQLPGYTFFSCERKQRTGGGVILYVKTSLHPIVTQQDEVNNVDIVVVQIKNRSRKLNLGLIYRPPGQSVVTDDRLYELIAEISCYSDSVIFGDFNLPVNRWGEQLGAHTGRDLYNNLQESALHQLVTQPTRGNNILDVVFSTSETLVGNVIVGPEFSTSDHRIVTFDIKMMEDEVNTSSEKVPDFRLADFGRLRSLLADLNWSEVLAVTDINKSWEKFTESFNEAVGKCVPLRTRRANRNTKPKWWNNRIQNNLSAKKRAFRKYLQTQELNDKQEYERLRRETKKMIRNSKKNLELHIANASKENPKEFYNYARKKRVLSSNIGPLIMENGQHTEDDSEMADILNEYFASVFTSEDNTAMPPSLPPQDESFIDSFVFTENDILRTINKLKANKTPGPDKISPRIIKEVKNEILKPLSILFNKSLASGKVPSEWKLANVTPIFKKGDKSKPNNYRPISLTSVVCKLMETVIRDKVVTYLEENKLINNSQHGFRNKRSCLTNLLDFYNDVFSLHDECGSVDVVYLDFQKAFDKVPHNRLLNKVHAHGIRGNIHRWLKDWLAERKQRVVLNGRSSNWRNVISGVPQGSVLGPVLFLIYVNDMDEGLSSKISKFADDTKIASKIITTEDRRKFQNDLDRLANWAQSWQMKFNVEKCKVLHIGNSNDQVNYKMNGAELSKVTKEKDLGVVISSDLKPSLHCKEVMKTANKLVGFIGRTFEYKSEKVIRTLYNSLIRPHLEYCVQFWSPYYRKDIEKLERIQRRVTKMIPRLRNKPYEERLKEMNLFSLSRRRMRGDLIEVYKIFKGLDNINVNDYFTVDRSNATRNNGYKIIGKRFRTNESKHFFFNRVVNVWNSLPAHVVDSGTIETFKNRLDKFCEANPQLAYFSTG